MHNLNSKPIREIFAVAVNDDKACAAPKLYLPVGHFSGIGHGCICKPPSGDVYIGRENRGECNCPKDPKDNINATGRLDAYIWKNKRLCVEYFLEKDFTNLLAVVEGDEGDKFKEYVGCPKG